LSAMLWSSVFIRVRQIVAQATMKAPSLLSRGDKVKAPVGARLGVCF